MGLTGKVMRLKALGKCEAELDQEPGPQGARGPEGSEGEVTYFSLS